MSQALDIIATSIADLVVVQRSVREDSRGYLSRFYCDAELAETGFPARIRQINHTLTRRIGSVRGLHFQHPPHGEDKLVSCIRGKVYDVAVDLRRDSATFLHWHAEVLSADNHRSLLVPKGFAHGFQTLSEDCELIYLHSQSYEPRAEGALNFADPKLSISWPLPVADVSARDQSHPLLTSDFKGLTI